MDNNSHVTQVPANNNGVTTATVCAAMGAGAVLFGAGYLVASLVEKPPIHCSYHFHAHSVNKTDYDDQDDRDDSDNETDDNSESKE